MGWTWRRVFLDPRARASRHVTANTVAKWKNGGTAPFNHLSNSNGYSYASTTNHHPVDYGSRGTDASSSSDISSLVRMEASPNDTRSFASYEYCEGQTIGQDLQGWLSRISVCQASFTSFFCLNLLVSVDSSLFPYSSYPLPFVPPGPLNISPMEPCEKELYRSLQDVLGPAIAPVIGKAIIDGLPVVAAGSLCTISQTIGTIGKDVADNLVHGIQGLAVAVTEADKDYWKGVMYTALGAAIGFALAPVVLQLIVGALGFGAGGIAGGTPAAALMASYGGHVTVGSLCAGLQSIGAAGLGASAAALANLGGAAIGGAVGAKLGDFHLDDVLKIKEKLVERTDRWLSGKGA